MQDYYDIDFLAINHKVIYQSQDQQFAHLLLPWLLASENKENEVIVVRTITSKLHKLMN